MKQMSATKGTMFYYIKVLSVLYFIGFVLHVADLFDIRLKFSAMNFTWQSWIVFLTVADLITAVGLWRLHRIGILGFHVVAITQLIAYTVLAKVFGFQIEPIIFHAVTLLTYHSIRLRNIPPSGVNHFSGTKT